MHPLISGCLVGTGEQLPRSLLTSLAHPKPLHRPRALPTWNGQRRSKELMSHSCPGRADAASHWRKSDGCFVRPTYCWVYVIWRLIGLYYWGGRTSGCPTLSAKGGTTRLQFSPFLRRRSARAVKTRRLSDYMAHLTLSPYFLDTVWHLTLYIVLPPFLNISLCRDSTRWTTYGTKWMNLHLKCIYIHPYVVQISTKTYI